MKPLNALQKIYKGQKAKQSDFEQYMLIQLSRIKNPTDADKMEFENTLRGGDCMFCGKSWIKGETNNRCAQYECFIPVCDCLKRNEVKGVYRKREQKFLKNSSIPTDYKNCTVYGMDRNVNGSIVSTMNYLKEYIKNKSYMKKGLILYGEDSGTGKTHMLISVMKIICIQENLKGLYVSASNIVYDELDGADKIRDIIKKDIVLIDDIDKASTNTEYRLERFFALIDGLTTNNKILLSTGNFNNIGDLMMKFNKAIVSRLIGSCEWRHIEGEDYRPKKKG